jgi:competence protein ComEC
VACALAAGTLLLGLGRAPEPGFGATTLCVRGLDVGQGDAWLVTWPDGARWLIDGGGDPMGFRDVGRALLLPALRLEAIEHLDKLVATHGDADHTDGLIAVIEELSVGELWIPGRRRMTGSMRRLVTAAQRRGVPIRTVEGGDVVRVMAPAGVRVLHPGVGQEPPRKANDRSLVLRLELGRVSFLMTGDVEVEAEARLLRGPLRSTVMKVPHHGSKTSSTPPFVDAVDPLVAIAGIGADNRWGFPHASVRARYLTRHVPIYWTGRHGELRICTDGWSMVASHRDGPRWEELRRWSAADIQRWWQEGLEAPPRVVSIPCEEGKRPTRKRRKRKKKKKKKKPEATVEPDEVEPERLLNDREWERRRKKRGKLRPGW